MIVKSKGLSWDAKLQQLLDEGIDFDVIYNSLEEAEGNIEQVRKALVKEARKKTNHIGVKLMESEKTCDGIVLVGKEQAPIRVHRAIMAGNSLFFEQAFFSEERKADVILKEPDKKKEESQVPPNEELKGTVGEELKQTTKEDLKEVNYESFIKVELKEMELPEFKVLLEYCYTGKLNLPSLEIGKRMYETADSLQMGSLKHDIVGLVQGLLTVDDALDTLFFASKEFSSATKEVTSAFIVSNADKIFSQKDILNNLTLPDIELLLKLKLEVKEDILLKRILEYAEHTLPKDMDKKTKRKEIATILELIDVNKLGGEGMKLARSSGLFSKGKMIDAVLASSQLDKLLISSSH